MIYFQYFLDMSQNCWVFIEAIHLYCLVSIPYNMDWSEFAVSKYWYWANGFPLMCTLFWTITHKHFNDCSNPNDESTLDEMLKKLQSAVYEDEDITDGDITDESLLLTHVQF